METRIGEWYLCEGYIEEPVRVEALEADRVQVRYLTSGRIRWLGYPRIWLACKPHPLPYQVEFDPQDRAVVLHALNGTAEPQQLSLNQLRVRFLPHVPRPRPARRSPPIKAPRPRQEKPVADALWPDYVEADADDESGLEIDFSY